MQLTTYDAAVAFLRLTQPYLEREEAANNLMLGIVLRLAGNPASYGSDPVYLATVSDEEGLVAAATMTPPHNLLVYGARPSCEAALGLIAQNLERHHWSVPGVLGQLPAAHSFAEAWHVLTGQSVHVGMRERVYELRRVLPVRSAPGWMRTAGEADLPLLKRWLEQFVIDARMANSTDKTQLAQRMVSDQDAYLWEDGQIVSLAARSRRLPHGIAIGPVYTPSEFRGRGYATSCVAALSQRLLDEGWQYCCLFTDLSNPTSNDIYQQIGYRPLCDYEEYLFQ